MQNLVYFNQQKPLTWKPIFSQVWKVTKSPT